MTCIFLQNNTAGKALTKPDKESKTLISVFLIIKNSSDTPAATAVIGERMRVNNSNEKKSHLSQI